MIDIFKPLSQKFEYVHHSSIQSALEHLFCHLEVPDNKRLHI